MKVWQRPKYSFMIAVVYSFTIAVVFYRVQIFRLESFACSQQNGIHTDRTKQPKAFVPWTSLCEEQDIEQWKHILGM